MGRTVVCAVAGLALLAAAPHARAEDPANDGAARTGARHAHCWPGHPCLRGVVIHRVCLSREEGDGERRCLRWGRRI